MWPFISLQFGKRYVIVCPTLEVEAHAKVLASLYLMPSHGWFLAFLLREHIVYFLHIIFSSHSLTDIVIRKLQKPERCV